MDQHVAARGDAGRLLEILLGHEHGQTERGRELGDLIDHACDQDRRESDGRLVDQQDTRSCHQGASEGEHLLLAPAHRAGKLPATFLQTEKRLETEIHMVRNFAPGFAGTTYGRTVGRVIGWLVGSPPALAAGSPQSAVRERGRQKAITPSVVATSNDQNRQGGTAAGV